MDYFLAVMIIVTFGLNFVLLCGLVGSVAVSAILDLFDKELKQYRLAGSLAKAVEKANPEFKVVAISHGDYGILVARKSKESTND